MTTYALSVIYLGNAADLDPIDGNGTAENASDLLGTYFGAADPAAGHIVTIRPTDSNNDLLIDSNDGATPEGVQYDLGSGPVNTFYDALFNVDATVTFGPETGQPAYTGLGGVIQTETGDLFFVMVDDNEGFGSNPYDDFPIESITINSVSAFGSQSLPEASDTQSFVPCFGSGMVIITAQGPCAVEHLRVGDRVLTRDNGMQPVRWVGRRHVMPARAGRGPVRVARGALGGGAPTEDLVVSPQHRLLLRLRDGEEVLVPAAKLVGMAGITRAVPGRMGLTYHHFACEAHEVVWANGAATETFLIGPYVEQMLETARTVPLARIFPKLATGRAGPCVPARRIVSRQCEVRAAFAPAPLCVQ